MLVVFFGGLSVVISMVVVVMLVLSLMVVNYFIVLLCVCVGWGCDECGDLCGEVIS